MRILTCVSPLKCCRGKKAQTKHATTAVKIIQPGGKPRPKKMNYANLEFD